MNREQDRGEEEPCALRPRCTSYIRWHDERDGPNGACGAEDQAGLEVKERPGLRTKNKGDPYGRPDGGRAGGHAGTTTCLALRFPRTHPQKPPSQAALGPADTHTACPIIICRGWPRKPGGRRPVSFGHITGAGPLPNSEPVGPLGGCARRAIGRGRSGLHKRCSAPCRFPARPPRACAWPATSFAAEPSVDRVGTARWLAEIQSRRRPIPPNLGPLSAESSPPSLGRCCLGGQLPFPLGRNGGGRCFRPVSFPLAPIALDTCWSKQAAYFGLCADMDPGLLAFRPQGQVGPGQAGVASANPCLALRQDPNPTSPALLIFSCLLARGGASGHPQPPLSPISGREIYLHVGSQLECDVMTLAPHRSRPWGQFRKKVCFSSCPDNPHSGAPCK